MNKKILYTLIYIGGLAILAWPLYTLFICHRWKLAISTTSLIIFGTISYIKLMRGKD